MTTLSNKLNYLIEKLKAIYPDNEAESISLLLLEYHGFTKPDIRQNMEFSLDNSELDKQLNRLLNNEPIQHVLGKAHFYGLDFIVSKHTLIPRRETEELVHLIVNEQKNRSIKLLDIGTGSGIIPIGIKYNLPNCEVWSMDVSKEAIEIAKSNASSILGEDRVTFIKDDILDPLLQEEFDVIVSNPPYVTEAEKEQMSKNVLDFDPHLALFVPDTDPLKFYRAIAKFCKSNLKQGGKLYVEINEAFGKETAALFEELGLKQTAIIKDMQGKDRIVTAIK